MRPPRDTDTEIWRRQLSAYRAMGPQGRLRRAIELSEEVRELARAGIRAGHPDWPEARVGAELVRRQRPGHPGAKSTG
jgi:hypothetical protein